MLNLFLDPSTLKSVVDKLSVKYGHALLEGAWQGTNALPFAENVKDLFSPFFADFMSVGFMVGYLIGQEDAAS